MAQPSIFLLSVYGIQSMETIDASIIAQINIVVAVTDFVNCVVIVVMRIKLNFADIRCCSESSLPKAWFLLDPNSVKTVADLAKQLTHRFQLKCDSDCLQLMLDDCQLPDWESTWILRDDDTVGFVHYLCNG